jgi:hypothetical protein
VGIGPEVEGLATHQHHVRVDAEEVLEIVRCEGSVGD